MAGTGPAGLHGGSARPRGLGEHPADSAPSPRLQPRALPACAPRVPRGSCARPRCSAVPRVSVVIPSACSHCVSPSQVAWGASGASGPHQGHCFVAPVPSGSSDSPSLHWLCVRSQPSSGIPGSHGEGSVTPRASLPAPDRCPRTSTRHRARMSRGVLRSRPARRPFLPARSSPGAVRSAPASAVRPVGPLGAGGLHTSSPTFPPARLNASAPASPGPPLSPASVGSWLAARIAGPARAPWPSRLPPGTGSPPAVHLSPSSSLLLVAPRPAHHPA